MDSRNTNCYHWLEIRYHLPGQTGIKQCNTEQANQQITTTNDGERNIMILKFDSKLSRDRRSSQNHKFSLQVEAVGGTLVSNPCNPNPCKNSGTCAVTGSNYECTCPSGWTGTTCDVKTQSCQPNPCQNGGTCNIIGNSITCVCRPQFVGPNCETFNGWWGRRRR
nr:versican core protein-like [Crassostrea gigas]|eukprot:XP_019926431.1 PREDICTED: versican core protein-like [Crassostrea gigas]